MKAWDKDIGIEISNIFFDEKDYIKKNTKKFYFMTFHTKLQRVQNDCVLGTMK